MLKKYMFIVVSSMIVVSSHAVASENVEYSVVAEAELLKSEVNALCDQLTESWENDEGITGKKKADGVRYLKKLKLSDEQVQKMLEDKELSDAKKAKMIRLLRKLKDQAVAAAAVATSEMSSEKEEAAPEAMEPAKNP